MSEKRICKITGQTFVVSDAEIALRESFGVPLPTVHPTERIRELLAWRNTSSLYTHICDLCKKSILSFYNPTNTFPQYCKSCFWSDTWNVPSADIDFSRPFLEQLHELYKKTPSLALSVTEPMENSDYCNAATSMKDSYMCFNAGFCENSLYLTNAYHDKECLDMYAIGNSEMCYECMAGGRNYKVFWAERVIHCSEGMFLYDCQDCMNCFMSAGLRHKQYVIRNVQLSKDDYERRMAEIRTGSHSEVMKLLDEFRLMKRHYPKRLMDGIQNEDVSGNYIYRSKAVHESYMMSNAEQCVNCYNLVDRVKDCLDVSSFGYGLERVYCSSSIGGDSYAIRYGFVCIEKSHDIEYSMELRGCSDCFGCAGLRKKQYCILNKQYTKEEYKTLRERLIAHMKTTGEYGKFFPRNMSPFGYNETEAQLVLPLLKENAEGRGYRWYEKEVPHYSSEDLFVQTDDIRDIEWNALHGKVIICKESGRPFKIIKQEFDFYKKHTLPLPRLHPDVRLKNRFPTGELYNLHDTQCNQCGIIVQTSMRNEDSVLCESCYQKAVY